METLVNEESTKCPEADDRPRRWWRPDSQAMLVSLVVHIALIFALAGVPVIRETTNRVLDLVAIPELEEIEEIEVLHEVVAAEEPSERAGANSDPSDSSDSSMASSTAPIVVDLSQVAIENHFEPLPNPDLLIKPEIPTSVGMIRAAVSVKGATGVNASGIDGAVDQLTYEILRAMEESPTLVVWFFDQSISLTRQRAEIRDRFDRIYEELGVVIRSGRGNRADDDNRLVTAVVGFGKQAKVLTPKPIVELDEIHQAIDSIQEDDSGLENVFTALQLGLGQFKKYATGKATDSDARKVLFVVVTDERGDDPAGLEKTIKDCRTFAIPVYVLGVPAPFGRDTTFIKYVDPDPKFDQSPQWGEADQGPESIFPERVRLGYQGDDRFEEPVIDSGFGPYALSRLAYQTGGIFFTIHPNRRLGSAVHRGEIASFASDLKYFFDPEVMDKYRPDYVSLPEYEKAVKSSPLRSALFQAAQMNGANVMQAPRLRFVKRDEATLASELREAQMPAARIQYDLEKLASVLKKGESGRNNELSVRWSAAYDLALGTVLAHWVRTVGYIEMLAQAKRGLKFENPKNNTWILVPSTDITIDSQLAKEGEKALSLLKHVSEKHSGTPWGLLAGRELSHPIGWKWTETYTELDPPPRPNPNVNNNPPLPQDDQRRMLAPPPKRPLPKL